MRKKNYITFFNVKTDHDGLGKAMLSHEPIDIGRSLTNHCLSAPHSYWRTNDIGIKTQYLDPAFIVKFPSLDVILVVGMGFIEKFFWMAIECLNNALPAGFSGRSLTISKRAHMWAHTFGYGDRLSIRPLFRMVINENFSLMRFHDQATLFAIMYVFYAKNTTRMLRVKACTLSILEVKIGTANQPSTRDKM